MSWRAVYCQGGMEFSAQDELRALGIQTFCPYEIHRKHQRNPNSETKRQVLKKVPQFRNYLFAKTSRITEVRAVRGVIGIVSTSSIPLEIPQRVMDSLIALAGPDGLMLKVDKTKNSYWFTGTVGDSFAFRATSPFYGLLGQITSIAKLDATGEVSAWVRMFDRNIEISLPLREVGSIIKGGPPL